MAALLAPQAQARDAGLAAAAGQIPRTVRSRRRRRYRRAAARGSADGALGKTGRDREPARRRRARRDPGRSSPPTTIIRCWPRPADRSPCIRSNTRSCPTRRPTLCRSRGFSNTILGVGVPESMKIRTLADFVARARAEPGKFNAAVVPGITELAFDYFVKTAGLTCRRCPTGTSCRPPPTWAKAACRSTWRRTRSCSRRRRPAASRHWR